MLPELPPWLLRKEVSPKTSPPRPTCMVWRKSPSGGLIMSAVSRLFPCELDTQPTGESLPRLMTGALPAPWGPGISSGSSLLLVHAPARGSGSGSASQLPPSLQKGGCTKAAPLAPCAPKGSPPKAAAMEGPWLFSPWGLPPGPGEAPVGVRSQNREGTGCVSSVVSPSLPRGRFLSKRDPGAHRIPTATLTCEPSFCPSLRMLLPPRCLWKVCPHPLPCTLQERDPACRVVVGSRAGHCYWGPLFPRGKQVQTSRAGTSPEAL